MFILPRNHVRVDLTPGSEAQAEVPAASFLMTRFCKRGDTENLAQADFFGPIVRKVAKQKQRPSHKQTKR